MKRLALPIAAALAVCAAASFAGCGQPARPSEAPAARPAGADSLPGVILISCDTHRRDHMSLYGYERPTTPFLERFAQDAVVFDTAVSNEVWTLTAHMTMLTGLLPDHHGLRDDMNLGSGVTVLAERLKPLGYAAGGFTGHWWFLMAERGYGRGFDRYDTSARYRDVFATHALARTFLDAAQAPVFLFLHNYDAHSKEAGLPYDSEDDRFRTFTRPLGPPPAFARPELPEAKATHFLSAHNNRRLTVTEDEAAYMRAAYDDSVQKVDFALGELFDDLKRRRLYDSSLIIVTADHGESLGNHGRWIHGNVYDENVRVPLVVKFPGNRHAGMRHAGLTQLTDLVPTVFDILGQPIPEGLDGRSLLAQLEGRAQPAEMAFVKRKTWRGVRTATHKLAIELGKGGYELYDLGADPGESNNLYREDDPLSASLRAALHAFFDPFENAAPREDAEARPAMTPEQREQLEALGYVGDERGITGTPGGTPRESAPTPAGTPPAK